jgi:hypothetical protein
MRSSAVLVIPSSIEAGAEPSRGMPAELVQEEIVEQIVAAVRQPWQRFEAVAIGTHRLDLQSLQSCGHAYLQAA